MRSHLLIFSLLGCQILLGQSLEKRFELSLPASNSTIKMQWADINNDSLLDVVAGYKIQNEFKIMAFENSASGEWPMKNLLSTTLTETINFVIHDYNKDNLLDLIVLNENSVSTQVYLNHGDFGFTKDIGNGPAEIKIKDLQMADMDNDGKAESVWTDGTSIKVTASLGLAFSKVSSFQLLDFDNNGFRDVVASGIDLESKPSTYLWLFENSIEIMDTIKVTAIDGQITAGDLNHDGYFDIIVAGRDISGHQSTRALFNNKTSFSIDRTFDGFNATSIRIADFTSDGLADIAFLGTDLSGQIVNWIRTFQGNSIELDSKILLQDFGDYDRDGDLDLLQLTGNALNIYDNKLGPDNKGPIRPAYAFGLQVYDRMFFYWDKSTDDHSSTNSVTYDLKVFNHDSTVVAADFDKTHRHRMLVSHGNAGTNNFAILNIKGNYSFEIQAIDNAFVPQVNSICSGVCSACANVDQQEVLACGETPTTLTAPAPEAMWFSFKKGFVGVGDSYEFDEAESDTVFSFNPAGNASCASLRLFNIKTNSGETVKISHTHYDCEGRNVTLEVAAGWKDVSWKNNLNSKVEQGESLVHNLSKEITFTALATNDGGCALEEEFILKVSKPNLQVNGNQFQIMSGSSVQLSATGGNLYEWKPSSSLNNHQIANPVASPGQTTEYTVTAYDTLGCTGEAKILVEVSEEAFIPTLFTPNDDGRNDNLRIFGIVQANDFHFAIYNREGSKLFETTSVNEATQVGWTGAVNGTRQPPGTYYWKVKGKMPKGDLLLNGKKSGVVLLVR